MSLEQIIAELTVAVKENTAVQQAVLKTLSAAAGAASPAPGATGKPTPVDATPAAAPAPRGRGRPPKAAAAPNAASAAPEAPAAQPPAPAAAPPGPSPAQAAQEGLTVKTLTDKCLESLNKAGRAPTVAIFEHYKVSRASEIKPEQWQEAYGKFQAAIDAAAGPKAAQAPAAATAAPAKAEGDLV